MWHQLEKRQFETHRRILKNVKQNLEEIRHIDIAANRDTNLELHICCIKKKITTLVYATNERIALPPPISENMDWELNDKLDNLANYWAWCLDGVNCCSNTKISQIKKKM